MSSNTPDFSWMGGFDGDAARAEDRKAPALEAQVQETDADGSDPKLLADLVASLNRKARGQDEQQAAPAVETRDEAPGEAAGGAPVDSVSVLHDAGDKSGASEAAEVVGGVDVDLDLPPFSAIMGSAGTGKTYQARKLLGLIEGAELCATTGIAALNLGAGVTTINSLIGFFDTASLRDFWISGRLAGKLGRLYANGVTTLVIDEMSMMDGEQLTILVRAVEELREAGVPMRLVLVGDFCQLPPVKAKFAFEVDEWDRFAPNVTRLQKVWRQEDRDFVEALQAVRRGDRRKAGEFFGEKVERTLEQEYDGTTILAKNAEVDRYNLLRHSKVSGEANTWTSYRWGKERSEWKNIPKQDSFKIGALVMILANRKELGIDGRPTGEYEYVNGDLGEVVGWWAEPKENPMMKMKLKRDGREVDVCMVTRENLVPLDKERRRELKRETSRAWDPQNEEPPRGAGCIRGDNEEWECLGAVQYLPVRLAWATTVHKSQGLTLDKCQLSISDHFWETGGMLYVALSRARTAAGLKVVGSRELFLKRINTDPRVKEWL